MLKDHYCIEDTETMLNQIEKLFKTSLKAVEMAENAEFSTKNDLLADMNHSLEMLMALNRKKINRELDDQAWAYVGSKTYV